MNPDYAGQIREDDLYLINPVTKAKVYDPRNPWNFTTNSGTIAHLIQPNNTLSAEIDIGAQATVIRKNPQGNIITNADQLIRCSQYGNQYRNSDPAVSQKDAPPPLSLTELSSEDSAVYRSALASTTSPATANPSP